MAEPLPLHANLLARRLAHLDRSEIERNMELQTVSAGSILFDIGDPVHYLYFPIDTIISLEQTGRIEVALAGREGMAGWTAVAGYCRSPYRAVVRWRGGRLLRIPVQALLSATAVNEAARSLLSQYIVVTAVQMAEGVGAHSHHRLNAAIARWLLMRHDRVGGDWIAAQHQEIAEGLGARRASVTDCLHIIEGDQYVRCRRGRILIRSRSELEKLAGGAYGAAEALYCASLGAFGKGASITPPARQELVHA